MSIRPGDSPRLGGEDKAHITRLAEVDTELPPILVDRRTFQVVDGMHRLMAASLQGRETIDVVFFDGSEPERFLRAVQENIAHGLPLSQGDRRAAAKRIISSYPHMSDRAIARLAGLAAATVATIRQQTADANWHPGTRLGRDGKVRPLNSAEGRRRAAEILTEQPTATLREVASAAGISPATVLDVRKRLKRGDSPLLTKSDRKSCPGEQESSGHQDRKSAAKDMVPTRRDASSLIIQSSTDLPSAVTALEKLTRDPSLRSHDTGRQLLRVLQATIAGTDQLNAAMATLPPHCVSTVAQVARQCAQTWENFAVDLTRRARVIDPASHMLSLGVKYPLCI